LEVQEATANASAVPLSRQIRVWRHGFYGRHALLYDFDQHGFGAYVTDFQRATRLGALNEGRYLLDDKLVSFLYLQALGAPSPRIYGFGNEERVLFLDDRPGPRSIEGLLEERGKLVVKPRGGSGGVRFCLLEHVGGVTTVNGQVVDDLRPCLSGRVVVSEFVEQHEYARAIYPDAANTLRILCLRDVDTDEPFVAAAIHRFGTDRSKPVDNTGGGGLPAKVDVATGTLGPLAGMPGYYVPQGRPVEWYDRHPDTGTAVTGTAVPRWDEIVFEVKRVMATLSGARMIGWDVVVTPTAFSILEGNNRPDVNHLQVHQPLLLDDRVRRFFEHHGVLGRRPPSH
jgi:hypothetical protein